MFDYLQKFNNLPKDLRDKVSSPSIMAALSDLESQYRVDLAMVVMKVMIKELAIPALPAYFVGEFGFLPITAEHLTRDLKEKILAPVAYYLDLMTEIRALDLDKDINLIIKEAGLTFPSDILVGRFRNVLMTYLKGIRNKIDTRSTLSKDVKIGGLNLTAVEIDRVFKVCESHKFKNYNPNESPATKAAAPISRLDDIIKKAEHSMASSAAEYNLKESLKIRQEKLDTTHELAKPDEQLDLPKPKAQLDLPKPIDLIKKPSAAISPVAAIKPASAAAPTSAPAPKVAQPMTLMPIASKVAQSSPAVKPSVSSSVLSSASSSVPSSVPITPPVIAARTITKPVKKIGFFSRLFKSVKKEKKVSAPLTPKISSAVHPTTSTPLSPAARPAVPAPLSSAIRPTVPTSTHPAIFAQPVSVNRPAQINRPILAAQPSPARVQPSPARPAIAPISRPTPVGRPAPSPSAARPQMHDIKAVPKVMGPIEELQFLDLLNFRRLGKTPSEITAKILIKIKLLEKDGYDKMVAGVRAWRQSPVNRLYLRLGQEAMTKGVTLKEAVAVHQGAGREMLTMEEVEAILDFNSKLVF